MVKVKYNAQTDVISISEGMNDQFGDNGLVTVKKRKISKKIWVSIRRCCNYARNDVGMSNIMIFGKIFGKNYL